MAQDMFSEIKALLINFRVRNVMDGFLSAETYKENCARFCRERNQVPVLGKQMYREQHNKRHGTKECLKGYVCWHCLCLDLESR